jgi:hypothetical protein
MYKKKLNEDYEEAYNKEKRYVKAYQDLEKARDIAYHDAPFHAELYNKKKEISKEMSKIKGIMSDKHYSYGKPSGGEKFNYKRAQLKFDTDPEMRKLLKEYDKKENLIKEIDKELKTFDLSKFKDYTKYISYINYNLKYTWEAIMENRNLLEEIEWRLENKGKKYKKKQFVTEWKEPPMPKFEYNS